MNPSISLQQILERSKLQASKISQQDLPAIERGLDQIDAQTKKLSQKSKQEDTVDIRAHYFLAQSGVNTQVLMRELGTIHLSVPIEQRQPIQDTDVDGYFYQKRTQTIIDLIHSEKQEIVEEAERIFEKDILATCGDLKERIQYMTSQLEAATGDITSPATISLLLSSPSSSSTASVTPSHSSSYSTKTPASPSFTSSSTSSS